ncbi:MAG: hypothetical protein KKC51_03565, partial [Verrucomicrobia bacterium]|nr:hypothetical protein [Verrucomicrobiota bacterium]
MRSFNRFSISFLMVMFVLAGLGPAFGAGADDAGNYTPDTFTNESNLGTGFGAWAFNVGAGAFVGLTNSTAGSGDIDSTNGYSFCFYGGSGGTYGEATRPFSAALNAGDEFKVKLAMDWDGGARGMNILDASDNELLNINLGPGNTFHYKWGNASAVTISTDYAGDAIVTVSVKQVVGNQLEVTINRNDGASTNATSSGLVASAAKVKFYNGGHAGNDLNYALFVNDLEIVDSVTPLLTLTGRTGMPANWTNTLTVTRNGATNNPLDVVASSSDEAVATVETNVTIAAGTNSQSLEIVGVDTGPALIEAMADGFPTATLSVAVFDVAYDDSSYYPDGGWTNESNGGSGFGAWVLSNNNGPGEGYTNYAGNFIGNSAAAEGGNVNAQPSGDAFGLYANQDGAGGDPLSEATRLFNAPLAPGDTVSVDLGVNNRNGSKGVVFQIGGTWLFEVAVTADQYVYQNHGGGGSQVALDGSWTNWAADTAIRVQVSRKTATLYDINIIRSGGYSETTTLTGLNIGGTPDRVRLYSFNTEGGDANNLFFNRLAIWSGEVTPELFLAGQEGTVVNYTNTLVVRRTGSTAAGLDVALSSSDTNVVVVPTNVTIGAGNTSAEADVVGMGLGAAAITAAAPGFTPVAFTVDVFNVAYDSSAYYGADSFTNESNGGVGFGAWSLSDNAGGHDGYTNYAGSFLGDSAAYGGGNVNSASNHAFGFYANQEGDDAGTNGPLFEALRPFTALAVGQTLAADFGVNFRDGFKGLMIQSAGAWLFKVEVGGDDYVYQNYYNGGPQMSIGWTNYAADTVIRVELTRTGTDLYNVTLTRSGTYSETLVLESIHLGAAPDQVRFYVFDTQAGGENNLYVNRLGINEDDVLALS